MQLVCELTDNSCIAFVRSLEPKFIATNRNKKEFLFRSTGFLFFQFHRTRKGAGYTKDWVEGNRERVRVLPESSTITRRLLCHRDEPVCHSGLV